MSRIFTSIFLLLGIFSCQTPPQEATTTKSSLKALILDGSNNHYIWPKTTLMMKDYLEETGLFEVDVWRPDSVWLGIKYNQKRPMSYEGYYQQFPLDSIERPSSAKPLAYMEAPKNFTDYDVIVSNLGGSTPYWPKEDQVAFEQYMKNGGGLVVIHGANNSWPSWKAFNEMIGLGGWEGRDSTSGPYAFVDDKGQVKTDPQEGICGHHGPEGSFVVRTRAPEHPIMKDLPDSWLHAKDEMYSKLRGPFQQANILATAFSDEEAQTAPWDANLKGSGRHEPMLMTIDYGKGRVFHSTLGHFDYSMECVGFITTLQRGVEWAATGNVTQAIPANFPSEDQESSRPWQH